MKPETVIRNLKREGAEAGRRLHETQRELRAVLVKLSDSNAENKDLRVEIQGWRNRFDMLLARVPKLQELE